MRLEILLIAADPGARDFVLRYLGRHRVTVAASPPEATTLLAVCRYGLVLVTNFGVRPDAALAAIPARRDYPVLFLTGHVTDRIEKACVEKAIPMLRIPEAIDMLRGEIRERPTGRPTCDSLSGQEDDRAGRGDLTVEGRPGMAEISGVILLIIGLFVSPIVGMWLDGVPHVNC